MKLTLLFIILVSLSLCLVVNGCQDQAVTPVPQNSAEYTQIDFEPAWSLSGKWIAYAHSDLDIEQNGIYIIDSNGFNKTHLVIDFARSPSWAPDEEWIVFSQFNDLYKIKTNGDSVTQITSGNVNLYPDWSSDNELIVYSSGATNSSTTDIYTIRTDGSQRNLIDLNANYPSWTEGSNIMIYFKPVYENGNQIGDTLVRYSVNTGTKEIITVLISDENKINMYPVSSGNGIIFCSLNSEGYAYIYKTDLNGNNLSQLTFNQGYSPDYNPENMKVVYTNRDRGNGRLWLMNENGSDNTQLTFNF